MNAKLAALALTGLATACIVPSEPKPAIPPAPVGPAAIVAPPAFGPAPSPEPERSEPEPYEPPAKLVEALAQLVTDARACFDEEPHESAEAFATARAAIADIVAFRFTSEVPKQVEREFQALVDALRRVDDALAPVSEQVPPKVAVMADAHRGHARQLAATQMLTIPPQPNLEPGTEAWKAHRKLTANAARQFFARARHAYEAAAKTAGPRLEDPCSQLARDRLNPPDE